MTQFLIEIALRYPKVAAVLGFSCAIIFSVMGISSYMEMQKLGDEPQDITLSLVASQLQNADYAWVNMQDGVFDCQSIYYERVGGGDRTEILLKDRDSSIAMLVTFSNKLSCAKIPVLPIQGVAYRMSEKHRSLLTNAGRLSGLSNQTEYLELCGFCGRANSRGIVILSLIFVPLSLSLYPLVLWGRKRTRKTVFADSVDEAFES